MLHAVAREDLDRAVVAAQRHRDDQRALGEGQPLGDHLRHVGVRQRLLELGARHQEERRVPFQGQLEGRCLEGQSRRSLGRSLAKSAGEALADAGDRDDGSGSPETLASSSVASRTTSSRSRASAERSSSRAPRARAAHSSRAVEVPSRRRAHVAHLRCELRRLRDELLAPRLTAFGGVALERRMRLARPRDPELRRVEVVARVVQRPLRLHALVVFRRALDVRRSLALGADRSLARLGGRAFVGRTLR